MRRGRSSNGEASGVGNQLLRAGTRLDQPINAGPFSQMPLNRDRRTLRSPSRVIPIQ